MDIRPLCSYGALCYTQLRNFNYLSVPVIFLSIEFFASVKFFTQHHLICSRFLLLVPITMFQDNFLEFIFSFYILVRLHLLLLLFHGKKYKIANVHVSDGFYYNSVKNYIINSKVT